METSHVVREMESPKSQARSFCSLQDGEVAVNGVQQTDQSTPATISDKCNFLEKCLVGRFNGSFCNNPNCDTIQRWFYKRWKMTAGLKVSLILHNLFLFEMSSWQEEARVKVGDWFWNGQSLSLDQWSPLVDLLLLRDRWIKAFRIALHVWSESSFQIINKLCGGFVDINEGTKKRSNLLWARIYVKDRGRNLPCKLELKVADLSYKVQVITDAHTKILDTGEQYDRKEKKEGWGRRGGFSKENASQHSGQTSGTTHAFHS